MLLTLMCLGVPQSVKVPSQKSRSWGTLDPAESLALHHRLPYRSSSRLVSAAIVNQPGHIYDLNRTSLSFRYHIRTSQP